MSRKNLSISLIAALAAIFLAACGGSSKHAPPQIMLAMDTPPPSALEINLSVPLSASVVNDTSSGGVVWSLSCDQANCGTLSSSTSASGDTIVYTAPATVPESDAAFGGMALTVTATSATDSTVFASASSEVLVISDTQLLFGNYAFYVQGFDVNGFAYTAAGSVNLDGTGLVLGGEEDFFSAANATPSVADVITAGTYTVNQNGTGNLVVNVATPGSPPVTDPTVGADGMQTFSVVAVNFNHLRIIEFDAAATSLGSLDFQTLSVILRRSPVATPMSSVALTTAAHHRVSAASSRPTALAASATTRATGMMTVPSRSTTQVKVAASPLLISMDAVPPRSVPSALPITR